jgi:hypothetical protein
MMVLGLSRVPLREYTGGRRSLILKIDDLIQLGGIVDDTNNIIELRSFELFLQRKDLGKSQLSFDF